MTIDKLFAVIFDSVFECICKIDFQSCRINIDLMSKVQGKFLKGTYQKKKNRNETLPDLFTRTNSPTIYPSLGRMNIHFCTFGRNVDESFCVEICHLTLEWVYFDLKVTIKENIKYEGAYTHTQTTNDSTHSVAVSNTIRNVRSNDGDKVKPSNCATACRFFGHVLCYFFFVHFPFFRGGWIISLRVTLDYSISICLNFSWFVPWCWRQFRLHRTILRRSISVVCFVR